MKIIIFAFLLLVNESAGAEATGSNVDKYEQCSAHDEALVQRCQVNRFFVAKTLTKLRMKRKRPTKLGLRHLVLQMKPVEYQLSIRVSSNASKR